MARRSRPPGPKGKPIIGNLLEFRRDPLGFLTRVARQYGDVVYIRFGTERVFLINNPDYIRDIFVTHHRNFTKSRGLEVAKRFLGEGLLTSEGEFHRRQRRLIQPAFHHKRIAAYAEIMVSQTERAIQRWQHGQRLDISREMMRLSLAIAGKALFDADVESEADQVGQTLTEMMKLFNATVTLPFVGLIEKLPISSARRFRQARDQLDSIIYRIINERRAEGRDHGDLLSMLLGALDEEGDGTGMTDKQVRDEAMTLFLAGHETTANALTWTWYLLSENREVEAKLHHHVDSALGGVPPTFDDLPKLRYIEMVVAEAMRIYPPVWLIGRRAVNDYRVGDYVIPAKSIILMSPYLMHRDERYFADPLRFDPERWLPELERERPQFSYFPFGGGPRVCIGEPFAWAEAVLVIATIARRWKLRLTPGHRVEPLPLITLRPKGGMPMVTQLREDAQPIANARLER
jgi:cytochrome P450